MPKQKPVYCESCGQEITEVTALERERQKQQAKAAEQAKEKELEKAVDEANLKIETAIKRVNLEHKGIFELSIDEWWQGDNPKDPIDGLVLNVKVAGLYLSHPLDEMNGMKEIKAFFKRLGSPLQ